MVVALITTQKTWTQHCNFTMNHPRCDGSCPRAKPTILQKHTTFCVFVGGSRCTLKKWCLIKLCTPSQAESTPISIKDALGWDASNEAVIIFSHANQTLPLRWPPTPERKLKENVPPPPAKWGWNRFAAGATSNKKCIQNLAKNDLPLNGTREGQVFCEG